MKNLFFCLFILLFPLSVLAQPNFFSKIASYLSTDQYQAADSILLLELQNNISQQKRTDILVCRSYLLAETHFVSEAQSLFDSIRALNSYTETNCTAAAQALIFYRKKKYWESLQWAKKCTAGYTKEANWERAARFTLLIALNHRLMFDYENSEVYMNKAKELYKKAGNKLGQVVVERYKGRMFTLWNYERRQQGKQILKNCISELIPLHANGELAYAYVCLVDAHIRDQEWDLALKHQEPMYKLALKQNDRNLQGLALHNYGEILMGQKKYNQAIGYFTKAITSYPPENKNRILTSKFYLAKAEYTLNPSVQSLNKAHDVLEEASRIKDVFIQQQALDWLFGLNSPFMNETKLLEYAKRIMTLKDTVYSRQNTEALSKQETEYRLKEIKQKAEIAQIESDKKLMTALSILAMIFVIGLLFIVYWIKKDTARKLSLSRLQNENSNQKQARLIEEKRRSDAERELAMEREQEQKRRLSVVFQAKKQERSQISRRLHDETSMGVHQVRQLLNGIPTAAGEKTELISKAGKMLQDVQKNIQRISYELSPEKFNENSLATHFKNIFPSREEVYNVKHILFVDEVAEEYLFKRPFLKNTLYEVVLTAVNNVIKHAQATQLAVNIFYLDGIFVTIEDNGKGFDVATVKLGLGFQIMKESAEFFEGNFEVDSQLDKGTLVSITIPHTKLLDDLY